MKPRINLSFTNRILPRSSVTGICSQVATRFILTPIHRCRYSSTVWPTIAVNRSVEGISTGADSKSPAQVLAILPTVTVDSAGASRGAAPSRSGGDEGTVLPLAKQIAEAIKGTGPIPLSSYIRQCLTSPDGGYYTTSRGQDSDQFGKKGDFITSPEISQMFGEMLGIWIVAEWMTQGMRKEGVQLVELGPGRGTLMDDILRTLRPFKQLQSAVETIYLIETSPGLREAQRGKLCGDGKPMEEIENGYRSYSKYSGTPVVWYEDIRFLPKDLSATPFILAHEFFDALPIHAFQYNKNGWHELLVSHTSLTHKPSNITTQPIGTTPRSQSFTNSTSDEFFITVSPGPTKNSLLLPELSSRYKALKRPGSTIEISPESLSIIEDISIRIGGGGATTPKGTTNIKIPPHHTFKKPTPSGAALIIDYGPTDTIPINSLRGIRSHKPVSPFSDPGNVDLSADVDFGALAERAIIASPGVEVHGPVEQGAFLMMMGMKQRLEILLENVASTATAATAVASKEQAEKMKKALTSGFERLVERGGGGMGRIYKVMAIIPENGGKRAPVGFGGDVGDPRNPE